MAKTNCDTLHSAGLIEAIQHHIESRLPSAIRNLTVESSDGTIILGGVASCFYHVQLASMIARELVIAADDVKLDLRISVIGPRSTRTRQFDGETNQLSVR